MRNSLCLLCLFFPGANNYVFCMSIFSWCWLLRFLHVCPGTPKIPTLFHLLWGMTWLEPNFFVTGFSYHCPQSWSWAQSILTCHDIWKRKCIILILQRHICIRILNYSINFANICLKWVCRTLISSSSWNETVENYPVIPKEKASSLSLETRPKICFEKLQRNFSI